MAGHSKFANIKHRKGAQDKKRAKIFTKLAREIIVAVKTGMPEPENNPRLRGAIAAARAQNMPNDRINSAIKQGSGPQDGDNYEEMRYEGYGPGNTMVIVDCLTDNNNRTISEVRNCFTKCQCKIGSQGSVTHMFDHQAVFAFKGEDDESVLEILIMADVDVTDVVCENGMITVFAPHTEFNNVRTALTDDNPEIEFEVDEITYEPKTMTQVTGDDVALFEKFIDMLEDCDDVQEIYHNAEF